MGTSFGSPCGVPQVCRPCNVCLPAKQGRTRVLVAGKTFAPYGAMAYVEAPVKARSFEPLGDSDGLPAKVDLRPYMSDVEDQSQTNSCCANAVAGAYEYINKRHHAQVKGDDVGNISRFFIYYVGRKKDQQNFGEDSSKAPKDEGMTLGGAVSALELKGACLEHNWPFENHRVNQKPPDHCFEEAMRYKISESREIPCDIGSMRQCLAEGHPIIFGLKLTARFFRPSPGGFINTPDPSDPQSAEHGLHAMLLVGYNDRQQVFIVRNSWGTSWGDQGYGYVPYDYVGNRKFNFLGQYAIVGLTDIDFTPDGDNGADFNINADADPDDDPPEVEVEEVDSEDDEDDDFDAADEFDPRSEAWRVFSAYDRDGRDLVKPLMSKSFEFVYC
eukprot:TRINITY_DN16406_c0_g1_i4.p1 TRINITY_DN16406_c0_g1~~TRINITY_DN16406_c0_g1_i4.p1  ORF type:complete len:386 (+),score=70.81 TRINITY_DN16406_c0_g1_i4:48-1205(+)